ncbi:variable surface protein [Plasmodium gonderi]|uniref:Variable surface protein n=1 Tax=Plasmodium gonderi TaxID=77519 RepID=A0A1Y1JCW7_PLAGO|nr:variable surface protein [Plasmodium gonderi]GAW79205.1 variable surface protein [Plasmodium gonderi]
MSTEAVNYLESLCNDNGKTTQLPSCEKYKKFNDENNWNECKECKECQECKEGNCIEKLPENYREPCKKICNGLKKLSTILKDEKSIPDRCSYYNYWTYEQLWKDSKNSSNIKLDPSVSSILQKLIWCINRGNCAKENPCYFYFDGTFDEWKKEKYMHDYFKNHDNIKNENKPDESENGKYCNYVTSIVPIYENYLTDCCTYFFFGYHWDHCPKYFKCKKDLNPYNLLKKLNCSNMSLPEYPERLVQSLTIDFHAILKSRIKVIKGIILDPFYIITLFAFSVLGILFFFFVFYKFTPLRSLVHKNTNKNKEMKHNFHKNSKYKTQPRKLQPGHGNDRKKKKINIAYNST